MSRSRRSNFTKEQIAQNQASAKNLLGNFIRNTGGGLVDFVTLGATDIDKRGDTKFQEGAKNFFANVTKPVTDLTKPPEERIFDPNETQLGSPLNRDQYNRDFRNMLITNTALRDYELGREAKRNMAAAKQYFEMAGAAQETAARRRLMEDQFSPTKISQQRLRAQTGEAALMQAIANLASAGAQVGGLGTGRRFGRG